MSLRKHINTELLLQTYRSSSLLPFLYETRTLISPPSAQKSRLGYRSIGSTAQRKAETYRIWRPNDNVLHDSVLSKPRPQPPPKAAVPFEDVKSQFKAHNTKQSTITASEKAVFDRIFNDIDQSAAQEIDTKAVIEDQEDIESDPYEDLNSIFDTAIQELRKREDLAAKNAAKSQHDPPRQYQRAIDQLASGKDGLSSHTFMRPLQLVDGEKLALEHEFRTNQEMFDKETKEHKVMVSKMLEEALTDVHIWHILEAKVFGLVKQLDAQIKSDEKARKAREVEERRAMLRQAKGKPKTKTPDGSSEQAGSRENGSTVIGEKVDVSSKEKTVSSHAPASVALPTNALFSVLRTNYSDYLLSALRLLRRHHPTSFYALHILPTMKRLGPISYVLGASTALYNEIIFLKWTQFSDLHGIADLMQEMINQGIETNEVTLIFLKKLNQKRKHGQKGRFGPMVKAWWNMRGNREGWLRVWGMHETIRKEKEAAGERETIMDGTEHVEEENIAVSN